MNRTTEVALGIGVLAALIAAALLPALRLPVLAVLGAGVLVAPRGSVVLWAFAAGLPVAVMLSWGQFTGSPVSDGTADCANILSPPAWTRVAEAGLVTGLILLLAARLGVSVGSLGLGPPTRTDLTLGLLVILLVPVPSLYVGVTLAEPFFGPMDLDLSRPMAILPALTLAIANGTMEELAYRGALMSWASRSLGPMAALVGQAIVFGAAHNGSDYVDTLSAVPVILAIAAGGLLAGIIVRRTGSLWLPIAVHIAVDVPLYYAAACRLP